MKKMMSLFMNETTETSARREPSVHRANAKPSSSNKKAMKLTDFSDDILHQIYAFIPTIQNLKSFAFVNKRASLWMFGGKTTDPLFGAAYERAFGEKRCGDGRKAWHELYRIRQCLSRASGVGPSSQLNTVGVLSPEQETQAVGYDHSLYREGQCLGYFGMTRLFPEGEGPIAIWGDFDGIAMVPSINDLLPSDGSSVETRPNKQFSWIQGNSQVLCVLASPLSYDADASSTIFFLGYASGQVQAVKAVKEGDRYSYEVISTAHVHTDEVTALAVVPLDTPCVASSSVDGTVMVYPKSFSKHSTVDNAVEACKAPNNEKILVLAATRAEKDGNVFLCTGSSEGVLTRWCPVGASRDLKWKMTSSVPIGTVGANTPTNIDFLHDTSDTFVVGTTSGCLSTYTMNLSMEAPLLCGFNQRNVVPTAHVGSVESVKIVGNVLLTGGAHEGHLMAWNVRTLSPIGSIVAHPGRLHPPSQSFLRCAVITTIVWNERESIVILCRDGNVREYSYSSASLKMQEAALTQAAQTAPSSLFPLKSFMANANETSRGRMRMRVIQAGLQNKKDPHISFVGVDGKVYEDVKAAFDHFSGLSPCIYCTQRGEGVSQRSTFCVLTVLVFAHDIHSYSIGKGF